MANPKLLISCGCSYTQVPNGAKNWPVHLTKYLNCETLYLGQGAAGNSFISKRAIYYINDSLKKYKPEDILVGVMWSSHVRHDFFLENNLVPFNEIYVNDGFHYMNPCRLDMKTGNRNYYITQVNWDDELSQKYYKNYYSETGSIMQTLENILRVQWFCEKLKIKYFFTKYNLNVVPNKHEIPADRLKEIEYLYDLVDWSHWLPIDNAWDWCIEESGFPEVKELGWHPSTEQNQALVDRVMIPYLKSMGYID
jgi:hypothetical protein